jgi:hypothetical protein
MTKFKVLSDPGFKPLEFEGFKGFNCGKFATIKAIPVYEL